MRILFCQGILQSEAYQNINNKIQWFFWTPYWKLRHVATDLYTWHPDIHYKMDFVKKENIKGLLDLLPSEAEFPC